MKIIFAHVPPLFGATMQITEEIFQKIPWTAKHAQYVPQLRMELFGPNVTYMNRNKVCELASVLQDWIDSLDPNDKEVA